MGELFRFVGGGCGGWSWLGLGYLLACLGTPLCMDTRAVDEVCIQLKISPLLLLLLILLLQADATPQHEGSHSPLGTVDTNSRSRSREIAWLPSNAKQENQCLPQTQKPSHRASRVEKIITTRNFREDPGRSIVREGFRYSVRPQKDRKRSAQHVSHPGPACRNCPPKAGEFQKSSAIRHITLLLLP